ncbi:hypothetical protein PHLCEN_2v1345 [Hermanssonia centrifuga]|uniref:Uncharacterized protein n=1 Tax=Hermanssonia centrifuga TaxID=98765 RepID=A0A2R6S3E9_9APHY|nr:hypothetical protein PHLCEN_2v1345 [Hermanssonia centrifuga]
MADIDEYDAYNLDFDIDSLPYIIDLPPSPEKTAPQPASTSTEATVIPDTTDAALLQTPKSSCSDEFTAYDFSEFTAEDLDSLDATTVYTLLTTEPNTKHPFTYSNVNQISSDASRSNTPSGYFGGPAIEIQIEPSTNDSGVFKAEDVEQEPIASTSAHHMPKSHKENGIQPSVNFGAEPSPFERFRRYNRVLAVTDLTGPSW